MTHQQDTSAGPPTPDPRPAVVCLIVLTQPHEARTGEQLLAECGAAHAAITLSANDYTNLRER